MDGSGVNREREWPSMRRLVKDVIPRVGSAISVTPSRQEHRVAV
ncbi:MAG: hypothetical protein ACT4QA_23330 [Panacagrimonas sp.]